MILPIHFKRYFLPKYIIYRSIAKFVIGPGILLAYYIDLIKDIILIYRLQLVTGGILTLLIFYDRFSSVVSLLQMLVIHIFPIIM